ncbi:MAG: adenine deaminase [Terrimicrobiaceae bacterium]
MHSVKGNIVDLHRGEIFPGRILVDDGRIVRIERCERPCEGFLIPGFVDAHIHIESSLLAPAEFSRAASVHGTVATVSDPHEIANVLGVEGIDYMIQESRRAGIKIFYGAPSCVPATSFESAGAVLDSGAVAELLARPEIIFLSEVMNFPGVLNGDPDLLAKIAVARNLGKPVDGHAPQLRNPQASAYAAAGISTDHECTSLAEALEKVAAGMKILIREGSAARNYGALEPLLFSHPERCMFCSDDLHPDTLALGHINLLVRRAVAAGLPPLTALRVASMNPVEHYRLPVGLLREGDPADFLVVGDLREFPVLETWVGGRRIARNGESLLPFEKPPLLNRFAAAPVSPSAFRISCAQAAVQVEVIAVEDGQLVTGRETHKMTARSGELVSDIERDLLKIAVLSRYHPAASPALGFITNFGLQRGAIASSVAHDSHNIIAVGVSDEALSRAINLVVAHRGGVCAVSDDAECILPLPIAGLMSERDAASAGAEYAAVEQFARDLGSPLRAPLMTLSFMALLVIPELKLSDRGLFDGANFRFDRLFPDQESDERIR